MIILTLAALSATADAGSWTVELAIDSQYPWHPGTLVRHWRALVETEAPDVVVQSDHPDVTCVIEDGTVRVEFTSTGTNYPTSFPVRAVCKLNDDELNVDLVPINPTTDWSIADHRIDTNDTITVTKYPRGVALTTHKLPACAAGYTYTQVNATGLDGVTCTVVKQAGHDVLKLWSNADSDLGSGYCDLPLDDQTTYRVHIDLDADTI